MNGIPRTSYVLAGVLALCGLLGAWLAWTRVRPNRTAEELLRHAPANAQIYAFLDVQLLRRTGALERIAGARGAEDAEYRRFVTQSGFDYRQHLDGVVMARRGPAQYAVIAGQFDGPRLRAYALANAGTCAEAYCSVPGTPPISFVPIRTGLYAFASGTGDARELLPARASGIQGEFLGAPVWATGLSPADVPMMRALGGAERLSLWLTPRLPAAVELRFVLETRDAPAATVAARELMMLTKAGDLARFLSRGEVKAEGRQVRGRLPLAADLLEAFVTGARK